MRFEFSIVEEQVFTVARSAHELLCFVFGFSPATKDPVLTTVVRVIRIHPLRAGLFWALCRKQGGADEVSGVFEVVACRKFRVIL